MDALKMSKCLRHHPEYYLTGGDLLIQIEDTVFRVHSHFFRREAKKFYPKQLDPGYEADDKRGLSEDKAVVIESSVATVDEFAQLLWVFYNPLYNIYEADITTWFTILRLAYIWEFPEVTRFALQEVRRRDKEIGLVERIVLYQQYKAPAEYLVPLFAELCARPMGPTDEEIRLLGLEQSVKVFRARERVRSSDGVYPLPEGVKERDTYPVISEVLELPVYTGRGD